MKLRCVLFHVMLIFYRLTVELGCGKAKLGRISVRLASLVLQLVAASCLRGSQWRYGVGSSDAGLCPFLASIAYRRFGWAGGVARLWAGQDWVGIGFLGKSWFVTCGGGPYDGFAMAAESGRK